MFEKWTKKTTSKITDSAVEGVKDTLNDKINQYGDIIQIGLVLFVIIFGGHHLTKKPERQQIQEAYVPLRLPSGGQPIVINNYYREREERPYHDRQNYVRQEKKADPKRENRR